MLENEFILNNDSKITDFKKVAWFGGSYSPPTIAHFVVAQEIGEALIKAGAEGEKVAVCIVPVSDGYQKGSIQEYCLKKGDRLELVKTMVEQLNNQNKKKSLLTFFLSTHEYDLTTPTATIDSLPITQEQFIGAKVYLSQGQDNITAIFQGKWSKSNQLLNYPLIVYPRGTNMEQDMVKKELKESFKKDDTSKAEWSLPEENQQNEIINNLLIIKSNFNDETSSSGLRAEYRNFHSLFKNENTIPNFLGTQKTLLDNDIEEFIKTAKFFKIYDYFEPEVFKKFLELQVITPSNYSNEDCEIKPGDYKLKQTIKSGKKRSSIITLKKQKYLKRKRSMRRH